MSENAGRERGRGLAGKDESGLQGDSTGGGGAATGWLGRRNTAGGERARGTEARAWTRWGGGGCLAARENGVGAR